MSFINTLIKHLAILVALFYLTLTAAVAKDTPPTIAAAADLKFALVEIASRFKQDTSKEVKLTFGSSGTFKTQIEQGAPFQLFLSADENYVFQLADKGLTQDRGTLYAIGRIVLFAPTGATLKVDDSFQDLKAALQDGRLKHFAIANPDHAPYGRAARAALQQVGIWEAMQPKLVLGENASQATQFAASGTSQGGIIPLSLSKASEVAKLGQFALIPAEWHSSEPLRQRMVLVRQANEIAKTFYSYLQQPVAREIFTQHGFLLPDTLKQ